MKEFFIQNGAFICWAAVAVLALIVEALTSELVSCWFAPSALVAMILSPFVKDLRIQLIVFLGLSILLLAVGRTLVKKKMKYVKNVKIELRNANRNYVRLYFQRKTKYCYIKNF